MHCHFSIPYSAGSQCLERKFEELDLLFYVSFAYSACAVMKEFFHFQRRTFKRIRITWWHDTSAANISVYNFAISFRNRSITWKKMPLFLYAVSGGATSALKSRSFLSICNGMSSGQHLGLSMNLGDSH
jgi:hypothetical protein